MGRPLHTVLFVVLGLSSLLVVSAAPGTIVGGIGNVYTGGSSDSNNRLNVMTSTYTRRGKCRQVVLIIGQDFDDKFSEPCGDNKGLNVLTSDTATLVGDPEKDPFALYGPSKSPKKLVLIKKGKCTMREYFTQDDEHQDYPLKDSDCKVIKKKMADEYEKNRKYWEEWRKNFEQEMAAFNKPPQPQPVIAPAPPAAPVYDQPPAPVAPPPAVPAYGKPAAPPAVPVFIVPPTPVYTGDQKAYDIAWAAWQKQYQMNEAEFNKQMAEYNQKIQQLYSY